LIRVCDTDTTILITLSLHDALPISIEGVTLVPMLYLIGLIAVRSIDHLAVAHLPIKLYLEILLPIHFNLFHIIDMITVIFLFNGVAHSIGHIQNQYIILLHYQLTLSRKSRRIIYIFNLKVGLKFFPLFFPRSEEHTSELQSRENLV